MTILRSSSPLNRAPFSLRREVHARALKSGHHSDLFVQNTLLEFYSASCDAAAFRQLFSEISSPDVVSWTSLVSALAKNGRLVEALLAFASMNVEPNEMTLVSALRACSRLKDVNLGNALHGICLRMFGWYGWNIILDNAVLNMYMVCGAFTNAEQLFDVMPHRDVVSGTTFISGYTQHGRCKEAIGIFLELIRARKLMPNKVSVVCVLGACASAGILRIGKWLHSYTLRTGFDEDGIVGNAFINMYSKCGATGAALKIFFGLPCRDLVSWCTIIWGMAANGRPKHAIQLFSLILCYGIRPDTVAFLAVLSACCHAGHVKESLMFFKSMYDVYGVLPEKEHYTCIIDMYGRAGCLREAEEFFHSMPMKPDKCVWGALLSACKLNGSNEAVHVRMQKMVLQESVAVGGGTYAILSNMFAKDERWDAANNVREQLNARKISKLVGYSWTEVT